MIVQQLFYIPVLVSLFAVSIFIFSKDLKNKINVFFGLFTSSLFLWLTGLFFADTSINEERALIAVRFAVFFACLIPTFFLWFSIVFPSNPKTKFSKIAVLILPALALMSVSFSNLMIKKVELQEYVAEPTELGTAYTLFLLYFVIYFLSAFIILIRKFRRTKKLERSQIAFVLSGTIFGVTVNVVFNFIFVILGFSGIGLLLGGPSILVFTLLVAYAIVKHRLFDIRLVIARSVGYLLSVISLGALYSLVSFILINRFFTASGEITRSQAISFTIIAVVLAFAFQPLKKFFDRFTNQLFYRDAYDPQQFISQLNKNLVTIVDIDPLLINSINVIEENLKSQFCVFGIRETSYVPRRTIGKSAKLINEENIEKARNLALRIPQKVIITDYLEAQDEELASILRENNISAFVRLTTAIDLEGIGYIALGQKKSGNPYNSQDIKMLDIIANELVIAIQNALRFEEIEKFNITLQEKVDDATKRLRRTNDKLKALDETKDEFISMASHQLRTPLTSVKGYLSMVLEGDAGDVGEMQRKLLDQAFVSSQRMVYLIADLLNVSRLRTGKFVIEPVVSNLSDVVEGEISQLKETAEGRGLTLNYDKPANFPQVFIDETKIRQVIMNFTDNAIYYTPKDGHITVKLEDKGESIEFTVNDDGMGVPKAQQPHMFTKFYRADNARKARPDGTGLGLFMAKKVIVAQGGNVIFHSQEGKGSTFGFAFPKTKLQIPTASEAAVEAA